MLLVDKYKLLEPEEWKYYEFMSDNSKKVVLDKFDAEHSERFITKYFTCGGKESAFDISFFEDYLKRGKHEHTVSLYFLGCCFSEIVNVSLKQHLTTYVSMEDNWYDFRYTWFLTCLYHDVASVIEKDEWECGCSEDLDFYLAKHNVQYNVFEHNWDNPLVKPYTYSESLIKNYFKYRVKHGHSIDHGIIAGYLLYDLMVKNYNQNWKQHLEEYPNANYDCFKRNNLTWRKEHISHFAIVADAIIAHNIWRSEKEEASKKIYRQYGLNSLIYNPNDRIDLSKNPLVFFLDLFDTIEPVKFFKNVQPNMVLSQISVEKGNQHDIVILINSSILKTNGWCSKVEKVKDWLNVTVQPRKLNQQVVTITISY